jgi:hypothetical protein
MINRHLYTIYDRNETTTIDIIRYIIFLFYNTKISNNIAESGKVPRMLAAFPR